MYTTVSPPGAMIEGEYRLESKDREQQRGRWVTQHTPKSDGLAGDEGFGIFMRGDGISKAVVSRSRIGEQVASAILREIVTSGSAPESYLPPEKDLASLFGVSRSAIRDALARLATADVVKILHGKGTQVQPETHWDVLSPLVAQILEETGQAGKLNTDLMEVRRILEFHAAETAAISSKPEERERLAMKAEQLLRDATDPNVSILDFLATDREFHDVLATICGNGALRQIIRQVHLHAAKEFTEVELGGKNRVSIALQHVEIAEAISTGDEVRARAAITAHMDQVEVEQRGTHHHP